jgi:transcriptional regulator with XRE-family HTH domain
MLSPSDIDRLLARRLKRLRMESGRSQSNVAKALGITADGYAKIEQRGRMPAALLARFAAVLNVSADTVLDVDDEARRPAPVATIGRPRSRKIA